MIKIIISHKLLCSRRCAFALSLTLDWGSIKPNMKFATVKHAVYMLYACMLLSALRCQVKKSLSCCCWFSQGKFGNIVFYAISQRSRCNENMFLFDRMTKESFFRLLCKNLLSSSLSSFKWWIITLFWDNILAVIIFRFHQRLFFLLLSICNVY